MCVVQTPPCLCLNFSHLLVKSFRAEELVFSSVIGTALNEDKTPIIFTSWMLRCSAENKLKVYDWLINYDSTLHGEISQLLAMQVCTAGL